MVGASTGDARHVLPDRAVVHGWAAMTMGAALEPVAYDVPDLGDRDVRVAVSHCGLCYTDVHAIDDLFGITSFPFVPGHEIVGRVEACGGAVTDLAVGDRVGIGWQGRSCERCRWCARGEEQLCLELGACATFGRHGGFSDAVTVDSRFAYRLPDEMASDAAAVLMCAGVAVFAPLRRLAPVPDRQVAIYGVGGLGHLAIQFAHALGCQVTALSSSPAKERDALELGADRFVALGDRPRMRSLQDVFTVMLCTAHGDLDWDELLAVMDKRGHIVLVGFPDIGFNPTRLVAHELSITGSLLGNHATVREMLRFAAEHRIRPIVEPFPMSRVNEAIRRLAEGRARYRIVLRTGD